MINEYKTGWQTQYFFSYKIYMSNILKLCKLCAFSFFYNLHMCVWVSVCGCVYVSVCELVYDYGYLLGYIICYYEIFALHLVVIINVVFTTSSFIHLHVVIVVVPMENSVRGLAIITFTARQMLVYLHSDSCKQRCPMIGNWSHLWYCMFPVHQSFIVYLLDSCIHGVNFLMSNIFHSIVSNFIVDDLFRNSQLLCNSGLKCSSLI